MNDITSNIEFLQAVFGDQWQRAHVTSFPQPPDSQQGGWWKGTSAELAQYDLQPPGFNHYYTVSLFKSAQDGSSRRTKELFEGQYALVLDDLGDGAGSKIPMSMMEGKPQPQYLIETSKDNYQVVYIFDYPVRDANILARTIDAMISQGLSADSDPGFKGVTRYVRLPFAINNKLAYGTDPFHCRLLPIDPGSRVSLAQIIFGWGLVLPESSGRSVVSTPAEVEASFTYKMLCGHELWTSDQGNGYWGCPCPNAEAHTVQDDRTGLNIQTGEFKCFHGSCESLNRGDLEAWLRAEYPDEGVVDLFGEATSAKLPSMRDLLHVFEERVALSDPEDTDTRAQIMLDLNASPLGHIEVERILKKIGERNAAGIMVMRKVYKETVDPSQQMTRAAPVAGVLTGKLAEQYLYVQNLDKYFDVITKDVCTTTALNISYMEPDTEGGFGVPANLRHNAQGGITVKALGWMPWPYFQTGQNIIDWGTAKPLANTYQPPPMIMPNGDDNVVARWLELFAYLLPDEREREVIINHMAFTLQHPEIKIQWQILWIGAHRIGKDGILRPLVKFLGDNASEIKPDDEAKWGDSKAGKKMLVYAEVLQPGDRTFENNLKTLAAGTSSDKAWLNLKGGKVIQQPNLYSVYAMSNHDNCMRLNVEDARWFAVSSMDVEKLSSDYYKMWFNWIDNQGGVEEVCAWLLARDLSNFDPGVLPYQTQTYLDIADAGHSGVAMELTAAMSAREGPFAYPIFTLKMVHSYLTGLAVHGRINPSILHNELREVGCKPVPTRMQRRVEGKLIKGPRVWFSAGVTQVPNLSGGELFALWEEVQSGEELRNIDSLFPPAVNT